MAVRNDSRSDLQIRNRTVLFSTELFSWQHLFGFYIMQDTWVRSSVHHPNSGKDEHDPLRVRVDWKRPVLLLDVSSYMLVSPLKALLNANRYELSYGQPMLKEGTVNIDGARHGLQSCGAKCEDRSGD